MADRCNKAMIKEICYCQEKQVRDPQLKQEKDRYGNKKHIIGEIAKTREETIAISDKIKEGKDQFVVFSCVMGLRPRRESLP